MKMKIKMKRTFSSVVLIFISSLIILAFSSKKVLDSPDESFGFSSNVTTVANMQAHRVGHCHIKTANNNGSVSSEKFFACTPDVMFVGASKAGTSSMAEYIQNHPMLRNVNHRCKSECSNEAHLFDKIDSSDEIIKYILMKQPPISEENLKNRHLVLEYTPNYLLEDSIPLKIKRTYPLI
jgi:hypothetical protein